MLAIPADVTSESETARYFKAAVDTFETVDMFHANAGVESKVIPIAAFDVTDYHKVFGVNVLSAFLGAAEAMRTMMSQPDLSSQMISGHPDAS